MDPRIFIGGTGRSGTTILNQVLGEHPDVHAFPSEMRFLVDPGGVMNLVDAYSHRFSIAQAREAWKRFESLVAVDLATPGQRPYPRHDLPAWVGRERFQAHLGALRAALVELEFGGDLRFLSETRPALFVPRLHESRTSLLAVARQFVDGIFSGAAADAGKSTWCEKTPLNLLHFDFLAELFPDAKLLHVMRDPRGVVESLTRMPWAPSDLDGACTYLENTLQRWFQIAPRLDLPPSRYLELRLEDLSQKPAEVLGQVVEFLELPRGFHPVPDLDAGRVDAWRKTLSRADLHRLTDRLAPLLARLGYAESLD